MSHQLPAFPLIAAVWRIDHWNDGYDPDLVSPCELSMRKPVVITIPNSIALNAVPVVELWFPKETDVRGSANPPVHDIVEFPAGTGRIYRVIYVDDYAKGFPNEFRSAFCTQFQVDHPML